MYYQKGLRASPCDKPKEIKQAYSLYSFQNGRSFPLEGNTSLRGLYIQDRPKRYIYFVPLNPLSKRFLSFKWKDLIYQFLCLCFDLRSASRIFTNLLKILTSLMGKLNVRLIIFLDNILLMAALAEGLTLAQDSLIYLFQNLGFSDQ